MTADLDEEHDREAVLDLLERRKAEVARRIAAKQRVENHLWCAFLDGRTDGLDEGEVPFQTLARERDSGRLIAMCQAAKDWAIRLAPPGAVQAAAKEAKANAFRSGTYLPSVDYEAAVIAHAGLAGQLPPQDWVGVLLRGLARYQKFDLVCSCVTFDLAVPASDLPSVEQRATESPQEAFLRARNLSASNGIGTNLHYQNGTVRIVRADTPFSAAKPDPRVSNVVVTAEARYAAVQAMGIVEGDGVVWSETQSVLALAPFWPILYTLPGLATATPPVTDA